MPSKVFIRVVFGVNMESLPAMGLFLSPDKFNYEFHLVTLKLGQSLHMIIHIPFNDIIGTV